MKAIIYTEYGSADVLKLQEVPKPTPKDNEVLIKVHAATVTTGDVNMRGFTFVPPGFGPLPRLMFGWNRPKKTILGAEVAGEIEAVGKNVRSFKEGDQVFGIDSTIGAYAEYVCRPEQGALATKPVTLSYAEAAAVPFGAGTALFFLRDKGNIQKGQKVLVNGASGGVGSYAVQLAKYFGAEVTGVCSTKNLELVQSMGADQVIDYTQEDFTHNGKTYDIIFDTVVGQASFARVKNSLTPQGIYLSIAGGPREMLQTAWRSLVGGKRIITGGAAETKESLIFLRKLAEDGHIRPIIDQCYPLEQTAAAHHYVDGGH